MMLLPQHLASCWSQLVVALPLLMAATATALVAAAHAHTARRRAAAWGGGSCCAPTAAAATKYVAWTVPPRRSGLTSAGHPHPPIHRAPLARARLYPYPRPASSSASTAEGPAAGPEGPSINLPPFLSPDGPLGPLVSDTIDVIRDTGLRATITRTLQSQRALLLTALDLGRDLPPPSPDVMRRVLQPRFPPPSTLDEALLPLTDYLRSLPPGLGPKALRSLFERLGATWIKVGQFIASSPTLFPEEYVVEFQSCLDQAPPVPWDKIRSVIEEELGGPLSSLYASVDPAPLASASIAQVHTAVLKDGTECVIKVQRPEVSDLLKADLGFIEVATKLLEALAPELARLSVADFGADLRQSALGELDFVLESQNLSDFAAFLEQQGLTDTVTCPTPIPSLSSKRVLTMTRLRGVPITGDGDGLPPAHAGNPERTVLTALNTWLLSVVEAPAFHADVHAGNVLALEDGRIGFIDFGIVGRVPSTMWDSLTAVTQATAQADSRGVARGLIAMGATMDSEVDEAGFAADIEQVMTDFRAMDAQAVVQMQGDGTVVGGQVVVEGLDKVVLDVVGAADRNGVKLPREFGLLLKQALYFDRYTKLLAPDIDVLNDERVGLLSQGMGYEPAPGEGRVIDV